MDSDKEKVSESPLPAIATLAVLGVGVAGYLHWKKTRIDIEHTPIIDFIHRMSAEELLEAAAALVQKYPNPMSPDHLAMWERAQILRQGGLKRRELAQERAAKGWGDEESDVDRALVEMAAFRASSNLQLFHEATERFMNAMGNARATAHPASTPHYDARASTRATCSRCGGAGWYVCPRCQGSGRRLETGWRTPTGNPIVDRLTELVDSHCPECHGNVEIACKACAGQGFTQ